MAFSKPLQKNYFSPKTIIFFCKNNDQIFHYLNPFYKNITSPKYSESTTMIENSTTIILVFGYQGY